jgi:hypothetical protein
LSQYPVSVNNVDIDKEFDDKQKNSMNECCGSSDDEKDIEHIKDDIMLEYILSEMSEKLFHAVFRN